MGGFTIHITDDDAALLVQALSICTCCGRLFGTVEPEVMKLAVQLGNKLNDRESGEIDA